MLNTVRGCVDNSVIHTTSQGDEKRCVLQALNEMLGPNWCNTFIKCFSIKIGGFTFDIIV